MYIYMYISISIGIGILCECCVCPCVYTAIDVHRRARVSLNFFRGRNREEKERRGIRKRERDRGLSWDARGLIEGWRGHRGSPYWLYPHQSRRPLTSRVSQYELKHIKSIYIYTYIRVNTFELPCSAFWPQVYTMSSDRREKGTLIFTIFWFIPQIVTG